MSLGLRRAGDSVPYHPFANRCTLLLFEKYSGCGFTVLKIFGLTSPLLRVDFVSGFWSLVIDEAVDSTNKEIRVHPSGFVAEVWPPSR
jgi:hypothetical protein